MKITVIGGAGKVGSQVAFGLIILNDCFKLDLIDIDKKRLYGEMADMKQAAEVLRKQITIENVEEPRGSDYYVICAGRSGSDRLALYDDNKKIILPYIQMIARERYEESVVLMVTNPSTKLTQMALDYLPLVIPIGNKLDNARLRLCQVNASHEMPSIQAKYSEVAINKGWTAFGVAAEVISNIRWRME